MSLGASASVAASAAASPSRGATKTQSPHRHLLSLQLRDSRLKPTKRPSR